MAAQHTLLRVMIIDDNHDAADIIAEFLMMCGYEARPVYSGGEALREAEAFCPDVIFLDLGMPDVSGYQVASVLRQTSRFGLVKIIALTAWGDEPTRARTTALGFDHHLVKPTDLDEILMLLKSIA